MRALDMSDELQRMDAIIMELMKADKYEYLGQRLQVICEKLEKEEVLYLLSLLRNPLLAPGIKLRMLEYAVSP